MSQRLPIHLFAAVLLPLACGPLVHEATLEATSTTVLAVQGPGAPSGLAYSQPTAIYPQFRAIAPNTPTVNGSVTSWSVFPALPAGLALDPSTGVITGSPLALSRPNSFTITASNANGSTSAAVSIRVVAFHLEIDPHQGGQASALHLSSLAWGRLVDVYDFDAATNLRTPVARNLVVGEDIQSDGVDYELEAQVATGRQNVTILHALGTAAFDQAYARLEQNLVPVPAVDPAGLPPFPLVARNAALVARFDDLLDAETVANDTLRVRVGTPPETPFDVRVIVDTNHGGFGDANGDGGFEFVPTRVILDLAVTPLEASASPVPLAVNPYGLPPSETISLANAVVRVPTTVDAPTGQLRVLTNVAGNALSTAGNGPVDLASPTRDLLRGARSGGPTAVTGDAHNGYLRDEGAPTIVERVPGAISNVTPDGPGTHGVRGAFLVDFEFGVPACRRALRRGDVILNGGTTMMEVAQATAPPPATIVAGVRVRMISGFAPVAGPAALVGRFDPALDVGRETCFVGFSAVQAPPSLGVATDAEVRFEFSEPIDPASVQSHDGLFVSRFPVVLNGRELIPAQLTQLANATSVNLRPLLPFAHVIGTGENYFVHVLGGPRGLRDLAGNALVPAALQSEFRVAASDATQNTAGFLLRFDSSDELGNDGRPELRGQFLFDFTRGVVRPRPVTHFNGTVDRTQPVPSAMAAFAPGVQAPLVPLGCKLQNLWRYCDAGFALLDESTHNVDVEGLSWAPVGGTAVADQYTQFEIRLAHSKHLPDESLDMATFQPRHPNSGVEFTYANNLLDPVADPQSVVHPRARGYTVNPADRYQGATGTFFMPYPLNRGLPAGERQYYTWRDTAIQTKGAPADSPGAELDIVVHVLGLPQSPGVPYGPGQVPTIGLPLLMEFRCFPDAGALGLNAFDVSLATLSSARPNFRAFSSGGIANGTVVVKDPDLQNFATGGFNPSSTPPGAITLGVENTFYVGEMQLVTRVSRLHTIFFDLGANATAIVPPVVTPAPADQPSGTQLQLAYRGATSIAGPASNASNDARTLDFYGDPRTASLPPVGGTVIFLGGDRTWQPTIQALTGAHFVQVRASLVSNAETNRAPELSVLGLAWRR